MKQINRYTVKELGTEKISFFSEADDSLIESYSFGSPIPFDTKKYQLNFDIYSLEGEYVERVTGSLNYKVRGEVEAGDVYQIEVNPVDDILKQGYLGDVRIFYEVTNDLFSPSRELDIASALFVSEISSDRTEVRLKSTTISDADLKTYANSLYDKLNRDAYFSNAYVTFASQDFKAGILNVLTEVLDGELVVTLKLYTPLDSSIQIKSQCHIVEYVGNSVGYEVTREVEIVKDDVPRLKGPNFNIDLSKTVSGDSDYISYGELLSYPANSTYRELYSFLKEDSAQVSIDHTDYSSFVHFSSARERLENFRWKLQTIQEYEQAISLLQKSEVNQAKYYQNQIDNIIANFDHYDRFLYFENNPKAWPKTNGVRPYINEQVAFVGEWWENQIKEAEDYDENNNDLLVNSIPKAIREDSSNEAYVVFVHMIGQHFDNAWLYAKAVADRYDGDNRLDRGISKDLVKDAIRSFGITLRESNQNLEELFRCWLSDGSYVIGSETSLKNFYRLFTVDPYKVGRTIDGKIAQRFNLGDRWDGGYAEFSGSIEDSAIVGSIQSYVEGTVNGNFVGTITASSFTGQINDETYVDEPLESAYRAVISGSITGSITGSFEGSGSGWFTGNVHGRSIDGGSMVLGASEYQPMLLDTYRKEVYKRIYHNLPYLLKTKGTNRGLRALVNCFGIPSDTLEIYVKGGAKVDSPTGFFGPSSETSSSIQKVRVDNTGSLAALTVEDGEVVTGSVLSRYAPVTLPGKEYSDDTPELEIGFNINRQSDEYFKQQLSSSSFDYDDLIGDPGNTEENYGNVFENLRRDLLESAPDFRTPSAILRLVRYFDLELFRSLDQFLPARADVLAGAIVEDSFLHRNRYKGVKVSSSLESPSRSGSLNGKNLGGEIDTGFISGSDGGSFVHGTTSGSLIQWSTATSTGSIEVTDESPKYTGELSGSYIRVSNGEFINQNIVDGKMVSGNPYTTVRLSNQPYNLKVYFLAFPIAKLDLLGFKTLDMGRLIKIRSTLATSCTASFYNVSDLRIGGAGAEDIIGTEYVGIAASDDPGAGSRVGIGATLTGASNYSRSVKVGEGFISCKEDPNTLINLNVKVGESVKFLGWYKGDIRTDDKSPNLDNYLGSNQTITVRADSDQRMYTARCSNDPEYDLILTSSFNTTSEKLSITWHNKIEGTRWPIQLEVLFSNNASIRANTTIGTPFIDLPTYMPGLGTYRGVKVVFMKINDKVFYNVPYFYNNSVLFKPNWI